MTSGEFVNQPFSLDPGPNNLEPPNQIKLYAKPLEASVRNIALLDLARGGEGVNIWEKTLLYSISIYCDFNFYTQKGRIYNKNVKFHS